MSDRGDVTTGVPLRIGIQRPDRPLAALAEAEARVVEAQLGARLGAITLDLRVEGDALGAWQPAALSGWPTNLDAIIDAPRLWGPTVPPLTALFPATVDAAAAQVRRRMLTHLGVLGAGPDALDGLHPTPTDVWLLAEAAPAASADARWSALARPSSDDIAGLARLFDALADEIAALPKAAPGLTAELARRSVAIASLQTAIERLRGDAVREQNEAAAQISDLEAQLAVARERLARAGYVVDRPS